MPVHSISPPVSSRCCRSGDVQIPDVLGADSPCPCGLPAQLGCRLPGCPTLRACCRSSEIWGQHPPGRPQMRTHPGKHRRGVAHAVICSRVGTWRRGHRGPLSFFLLPSYIFPSHPSADLIFSIPAGSLKTTSEGLSSQHSCPAQTREAKGASGEKNSWPESPAQPYRPQGFQGAEESPREPTTGPSQG